MEKKLVFDDKTIKFENGSVAVQDLGDFDEESGEEFLACYTSNGNFFIPKEEVDELIQLLLIAKEQGYKIG